jgi:formylglycine-generating enzyme required for sulfatase activity
VAPDDPRKPDDSYREGVDGDMRRGVARWEAGSVIETVEARSGPAYLEVDRGADCASSLLYLQHIPGYTERTRPLRRLHVQVPTCQASSGDTVVIPAGEFYRNVNLEDGTEPRDELALLPAYAIDRTEVTRGAFDIYDQMKQLTAGDTAAPDDFLQFDRSARESLPIVGVTYYTAMNYCQYHGKTLPSIDQWQKAFRGGLVLDGKPNPAPRRTTPWLRTSLARPANLRPRDGDGQPAPVASYPADISPYGVADLAGNVGEWTSSAANEKRLRLVLGGSWSITIEQHPEHITWRNSRADMSISYEIGIRCVSR